MERSRTQKRIFQHHLPLLLISSVSVGLIYRIIESEDAIFRMSMATAYPALALLVVTLVLGPLKRILNLPSPVSTDLRRDLGFWAALASFTHVVFGLQVHMRGRMWLLFFKENIDFPYIRLDLFGAANLTGIIATLILIVVLATSNDWSLHKLGWKKWKRVQRWSYVLFIAVIIHGVFYQIIEKRTPAYIFIFAAMVATVVIMRFAGFLYQKRFQV